VLAYGPLARGLLGGTIITEATRFGPGHWRSQSPAFTGPGFGRNLQVVAALSRFAADRGATIAQLAVAWVLAHPAVQAAIVGAHPTSSAGKRRSPRSAPSRDDLAEIDGITAAAVPLGGPSPEGMT
jgi:aryl-alcohol dehydrogenase-like predicted oxidoreductase